MSPIALHRRHLVAKAPVGRSRIDVRRRTKHAILLTIVPLLLCGLPFVVLTAPFSSYSTFQRCSGVQFLASPHELWCFIEVDRVVIRPSPLASPRGLALGHHQEVLVVSDSGDVRRIPVSIPDGVTFHPNISHIFRLGDEFYLYQGFSMNTHRSVYKWDQDHFDLLPLHESEALLKQHSLDEFDPAEDAVERIQLAEKWSKVFKDRGSFVEFDPTFEWNETQFQIRHVIRNGITSLHLDRLDDPSWSANLISYDGSSISDYTGYVRYTSDYVVGVEVGIRKQTYELDDLDDTYGTIEFGGPYAALFLYF